MFLTTVLSIVCTMPTARTSPGLSTDGAHMNRVDSGAAACTGSAVDSGQGVEGKVGGKRAWSIDLGKFVTDSILFNEGTRPLCPPLPSGRLKCRIIGLACRTLSCPGRCGQGCCLFAILFRGKGVVRSPCSARKAPRHSARRRHR